jgi:type I restriction enzyme R subunit
LASPEKQARESIDRLLAAAGWAVQDCASAALHAARGVALREVTLNPGHGTADDMFCVRRCGAQAQGHVRTLAGFERRSTP